MAAPATKRKMELKTIPQLAVRENSKVKTVPTAISNDTPNRGLSEANLSRTMPSTGAPMMPPMSKTVEKMPAWSLE